MTVIGALDRDTASKTADSVSGDSNPIMDAAPIIISEMADSSHVVEIAPFAASESIVSISEDFSRINLTDVLFIMDAARSKHNENYPFKSTADYGSEELFASEQPDIKDYAAADQEMVVPLPEIITDYVERDTLIELVGDSGPTDSVRFQMEEDEMLKNEHGSNDLSTNDEKEQEEAEGVPPNALPFSEAMSELDESIPEEPPNTKAEAIKHSMNRKNGRRRNRFTHRNMHERLGKIKYKKKHRHTTISEKHGPGNTLSNSDRGGCAGAENEVCRDDGEMETELSTCMDEHAKISDQKNGRACEISVLEKEDDAADDKANDAEGDKASALASSECNISTSNNDNRPHGRSWLSKLWNFLFCIAE